MPDLVFGLIDDWNRMWSAPEKGGKDMNVGWYVISFYILSLNNFVNSSVNIPSIVAIKCVIFNNISHTTRITSLLSTFLLVPLFYSLFSSISHIHSHIFLHLWLSLASNNFLLPALLSSIIFYAWLPVHYSMTR